MSNKFEKNIKPFEQTKRERPKYFNWKCYDNFDKVPDNKLFYDCDTIKLSPRTRYLAGKEIKRIREKYLDILAKFIDEINGENKTHLTVAGGNYTFFFVLPSMIKWIRERHPFLGVHIQLSERQDLSKQDADIVLTAETASYPFDSKKIFDAGYVYSRFSAFDELFFAASEESVSAFGSKENTLKEQDIVFGRLYSTETLDQQIVRHYSLIPENRKNINLRIIVDQYFIEYKMMMNSVGFGYLFTSMILPPKMVILDDNYLATFKRFVIYKRNLSKKYNWLGRRLINLIKHKGK